MTEAVATQHSLHNSMGTTPVTTLPLVSEEGSPSPLPQLELDVVTDKALNRRASNSTRQGQRSSNLSHVEIGSDADADSLRNEMSFNHFATVRAMTVRKVQRTFGAGGRESSVAEYVNTVFNTAVIAVVLIFYFFPTFDSHNVCNTTGSPTDTLELSMLNSRSDTIESITITCGVQYSLVTGNFILFCSIAYICHWLIYNILWTKSKVFRAVFQLSVCWNIIFWAVLLLGNSGLREVGGNSAIYGQFLLTEEWWFWLFVGVLIGLWGGAFIYGCYSVWSVRNVGRLADLAGNMRIEQAAPEKVRGLESGFIEYNPAENRSRHSVVAPPPSLSSYRFTYLSGGWGMPLLVRALKPFLAQRELFEYVGPLDDDGRPHGFGRWNDSQSRGESMRGYWEHGEPTGPFVSTEVGSNNSFASVHIAVCTCAGADFITTTPGLDPPTDLYWALAAVETSTSGKFLSHLPAIALPRPPELGRDAAWAFGSVKKMPERQEGAKVVITTTPDGTIQVEDHEPDPLLQALYVSSPSSPSTPVVHTRVAVDLVDDESLDPSGPRPSITAAESSKTGPPLVALATRTQSSSVNSRWTRIIDGPAEAGVAKTLRVQGWRRKPPTTALVFIHGFVGHQTCLKAFGQFLNLARPPAHITPVAFIWPSGEGLVNMRDGICAFAKTRDASSAEPMLQKLVEFMTSLKEAGVRTVHVISHSLGCRLLCKALPRFQHLFEGEGAMTFASCALLHPAYSLRQFVDTDYKYLRAMCPLITLYLDEKDNAQWAPELFFDHEPSLGLHPFALVETLPKCGDSLVERLYGYKSEKQLRLSDDGKSVPLDLDVVDTSFIDSNVEANRHGFWNVNRFVVDDLLECMTAQRRACLRQHRLTRSGRGGSNVWTFLAAPRRIGMVTG